MKVTLIKKFTTLRRFCCSEGVSNRVGKLNWLVFVEGENFYLSRRISLRLSMKIESLWLVRWHMYCLQEIGGPWRIKVKC